MRSCPAATSSAFIMMRTTRPFPSAKGCTSLTSSKDRRPDQPGLWFTSTRSATIRKNRELLHIQTTHTKVERAEVAFTVRVLSGVKVEKACTAHGTFQRPANHYACRIELGRADLFEYRSRLFGARRIAVLTTKSSIASSLSSFESRKPTEIISRASHECDDTREIQCENTTRDNPGVDRPRPRSGRGGHHERRSGIRLCGYL